jgi:hypothetical protein
MRLLNLLYVPLLLILGMKLLRYVVLLLMLLLNLLLDVLYS